MKFELISFTNLTTFLFIRNLFMICFNWLDKITNIFLIMNICFFFKKFKLFFKKLNITRISSTLFSQQSTLNLLYKKKNLFPTLNLSTIGTFKTLKPNLKQMEEDYLHDNGFNSDIEFERPTVVFNSSTDLTRFFIFKLFFLFNQTFCNSPFIGNSFFSFYSITAFGEKILVINYTFLLTRWLVSYDFLFNLNYFDITKLFFTSPLLRQQSLALNWHLNNWTIELWSSFNLLFILSTPKYSPKATFFFDQLFTRNISCAVISDLSYHIKNVFYLKKNFYFTIGLLNLNENPYILDYPIVASFENHLVQTFFLKLIVFIDRQSQLARFFFLQKIWVSTKHRFLF